MILPICKPSISTYLYHANYLSIIEIDPDSKHYLINNFLQLYSFSEGPDTTLIDFYSVDGRRPRYPFLSKATLTAKTLSEMGGDVVRQCRAILDSGCYIEITLDEFHLSEKLAYKRHHFPHRNLIYGYSEEKSAFLAQGFTKNLDFTRFNISYSELSAGFNDTSRRAFGDHMWLSLLTHTRRADFIPIQYSAALIKTYLSDFLLSQCSFIHYCPPDSKYGIANYELAIGFVEKANGRELDIRPWCIFYEHKLKLLNLYQYLTTVRSIALPVGMEGQLKLLVQDFQGIRNHLIEQKIAGRDVRVAALVANMAKVTADEKSLISAMIDAIENSPCTGFTVA